MSDEKRRFARVPFRVIAELTVNNVLYSCDEINNLSISGCLLPIKAELELGIGCQLRIIFSGTNEELFAEVEGKIIRCKDGAVAIKFTGIEPDSLFHLQNIVRYNYPDTEKIEKEISD
jgi:hypothetical protein